ncbi:hypothetical protein JTB14_025955 [Gonioctena quinquepunctata]|nr:hypothetical protein JTB14_025955 [Gonioctena quinquepunctata]
MVKSRGRPSEINAKQLADYFRNNFTGDILAQIKALTAGSTEIKKSCQILENVLLPPNQVISCPDKCFFNNIALGKSLLHEVNAELSGGSLQLSGVDTTNKNAQATIENKSPNHISLEKGLLDEAQVELSAGSLQLSDMDTNINIQASTEERSSNHNSLEGAFSDEVHIEFSGGSLQRSGQYKHKCPSINSV